MLGTLTTDGAAVEPGEVLLDPACGTGVDVEYLFARVSVSRGLVDLRCRVAGKGLPNVVMQGAPRDGGTIASRRPVDRADINAS